MNIVKLLEDFLIGFMNKPAGSVSTDVGSLYDSEADEAKQRARIIEYARQQLGKKYKLGAEVSPGATPELLDCSELVECAYRDGAGIHIPDGCVYQQAFCQKVNDPKDGDLIFLKPNPKTGVRHVLILAGNTGSVIHAKGGVGVVEESSVEWRLHPRYDGVWRHPEFSRQKEERA